MREIMYSIKGFLGPLFENNQPIPTSGDIQKNFTIASKTRPSNTIKHKSSNGASEGCNFLRSGLCCSKTAIVNIHCDDDIHLYDVDGVVENVTMHLQPHHLCQKCV